LRSDAVPSAAPPFSRFTSSKLIDLSVTLSERLPCTWPGHVPFAHKNWSWFTDLDLPTAQDCCSLGPYNTSFLLIDEHCGTHVDGPTHFIPPLGSGLPWSGVHGEVTADQLDLACLMGAAAVVDVRFLAGKSQPGVSPRITVEHLREAERRDGRFQPNGIVLLLTGWAKRYLAGAPGNAYVLDPLVRGTSPGWPALEPDGAALLAERGVSAVGIDAPSIGAVDDGALVHQEGLSRGLLFIEMLASLQALPARGAFFVFLPLKIAGGSGAPGRAVALVDGTEDHSDDSETV
jgi:isatin hydrolase